MALIEHVLFLHECKRYKEHIIDESDLPFNVITSHLAETSCSVFCCAISAHILALLLRYRKSCSEEIV